MGKKKEKKKEVKAENLFVQHSRGIEILGVASLESWWLKSVNSEFKGNEDEAGQERRQENRNSV